MSQGKAALLLPTESGPGPGWPSHHPGHKQASLSGGTWSLYDSQNSELEPWEQSYQQHRQKVTEGDGIQKLREFREQAPELAGPETEWWPLAFGAFAAAADMARSCFSRSLPRRSDRISPLFQWSLRFPFTTPSCSSSCLNPHSRSPLPALSHHRVWSQSVPVN